MTPSPSLAHTAALATLAAAVVASGHAAAVTPRGFGLVVDGYDLTHSLDFREKYKKLEPWSRAPRKLTGYYFSVGQIGQRKTYPVRLDGGFNAVAVAELLVEEAASRRCRAEAARQSAANADVATPLRERLGLGAYAALRLTASHSAERPVQVRFTLDRAMTAEQAEALAVALRGLGLAG